MLTAAQFQADVDEVAGFVTKYVKPALDYLATNETALGIEKALPQGAKIIDALGGADKALAIVLGDVPYAGTIFSLYQTYKALGGKPADPLTYPAWADSSDPAARQE